MSSYDRVDCSSYEVCKKLKSLLIELNVAEDDVADSCGDSITWPCDSLLHNAQQLYDHVSTSNAAQVLEFIIPLFSIREQLISKHFNPHSTELPFNCPEMGIDIYQPCLVTSCAFHTSDPWALNCILFYRLRHEHDTLNLNELSFLLDKDVGYLRSTLNKTFRQLSQGALKETIAREGANELTVRVHSDTVCAVCEHKLEGRRRAIVKSGFVYCSRECVRCKPPQVIKLEQELLLPIERILDLCVQQFSSVKNMCAALGVGPSIFLRWCDHYSVEIPSSKRMK